MRIKPYGDTLGDGAIQLSFTLPVKESAKSREAARILVLSLGFEHCEIVHGESLSEGFSFYIAYGRTGVSVDYDKIQPADSGEDSCMSFHEINEFIEKRIGRKLVVVGACTGSDAHTVGIDAIMNMKGYNHHYGLERYPMIEAHNLGAQLSNEELIENAGRLNADAIIISQVVTQRDVHVRNLTGMIELLEAENLRQRYIVVIGGPRIGARLALEMGFDAGFGRGTYAEHVATFIAKRMSERRERGHG